VHLNAVSLISNSNKPVVLLMDFNDIEALNNLLKQDTAIPYHVQVHLKIPYYRSHRLVAENVLPIAALFA
jgi:hypothetical protein